MLDRIEEIEEWVAKLEADRSSLSEVQTSVTYVTAAAKTEETREVESQ